MRNRSHSIVLQLALLAAFQSRRADVIQHLFENHGAPALAEALLGLASKEAAGILDLLGTEQQALIVQSMAACAPTAPTAPTQVRDNRQPSQASAPRRALSANRPWGGRLFSRLLPIGR